MQLDTIEEAIAAIAGGDMVIVVDDQDRENEGDLIMAASQATAEKMAFMIRHTSGIICAPLPDERAQALQLAPMVAHNRDPLRTAFTVSVDYRIGLSTGISAEERTQTVRALANDNAGAGDFFRPGHVFPLIARPGGVLTRSGHTEAGVDLARLAGLPPVGVLAELVNDDGTVKRLAELLPFAKAHGLKIISIEDLIAYRLRMERCVEKVAAWPFSLAGLPGMAYAHRSIFDPLQHLTLVFGDAPAGEDIPCRIHREQPLQDLLRLAGGEAPWAAAALHVIRQEGGRGILMLLRDPALAGLVPPPGEEEKGAPERESHPSAARRLQRWREVGLGAQILRDLGIRSIALISKHARDYVGIKGFGVDISRTILVDD